MAESTLLAGMTHKVTLFFLSCCQFNSFLVSLINSKFQLAYSLPFLFSKDNFPRFITQLQFDKLPISLCFLLVPYSHTGTKQDRAAFSEDRFVDYSTGSLSASRTVSSEHNAALEADYRRRKLDNRTYTLILSSNWTSSGKQNQLWLA